MEIFYAYEVSGGLCRLDAEESGHCCRVLRRRAGDEISVIDGLGTLYRCRLCDDNPKGAVAEVLESVPHWGAHPYRLTIACCPTKNNDRYEWMVEKVTEIGVDCIVPVIGERSERKVYKTDRARRIALSAAKQSLKARIPEIAEPLSVREFIAGLGQPVGCAEGAAGSCTEGAAEGCTKGTAGAQDIRLIAYCFEDEEHPRRSIMEVLREAGDSFASLGMAEKAGAGMAAIAAPGMPCITVLIGPEGDFSPEEARAAMTAGFIPVHLGTSRLRTETAAVTAATAVYLSCL